MLILAFIISVGFPVVLVAALMRIDMALSNTPLSGPRISPAISLKRKPNPVAIAKSSEPRPPLTSEEERIMELVLGVGPEFGGDERDDELAVIPKILEYATLEYAPVKGSEDMYVFECPSCGTGGNGFTSDQFTDMIEMARRHHMQNHVKISLPEPRRDKKPEPVIDRYSTVSSITDAELAIKVKNNDHAYRTKLGLKDGSVAYLTECNWCGGGWTEKTERAADVKFYIHDCNRTHR